MIFTSVFSNEMELFMKQREASFTRSTVKSDLSVIKEFDRYLSDNNCKERQISEEIVNAWIFSLNGKRSTLQYKVNVMQMFFRFLNGMGIKAYIPPTPITIDDYVPYIFSESEKEVIFSAVDNLSGNRYHNKWFKIELPMILRILDGCGMRIGETLSLTSDDIDLDSGVITVRYAKGAKQRIVPMSSSLTNIMRQYCCRMDLIGRSGKYLFPGESENAPLSVGVVYNNFSRLLKRLGIQQDGRKYKERGPCVHSWRHTFVVNSFRKANQLGRDINDTIPFLSTYLGHSSIMETDKYLKFSAELFRDEVDRFSVYAKGMFREVPDEEE